MPAYIEVEQIETPTCGRGDNCELNDNAAHHVRVKIGPAIIEPFEALLDNLMEAHDENMGDEYFNEYGKHVYADTSMRWHRKQEPDCEYCATIKTAERTLKAIRGKQL